MDRSQLDEAAYLSQFGTDPLSAGSVVHVGSAASIASSSSCAGCARLARAREAAGAQVTTLTRSLQLAEAEASSLRDKCALAKDTAMRLYAAARVAGVQLDAVESGLAALVEEEEGSVQAVGLAGGGGGGSAGVAGGINSDPALPRTSDLRPHGPALPWPLDDVTCEGDGRVPLHPLVTYSPHGPSNVLCCVVLRADVAPSASAHSTAPSSLVLASGSARGEVCFAALQLSPAAAGAAAAAASVQLLGTLSLPAPVLCLSARPWGSVVAGQQCRALLAASCMDGSLHILQAPQGAPAAGSPPALLFSLPHAHAKYATRVAWSPNGRVLASAGADGSVVLMLVPPTASGIGEACGGGVARVQQLHFSAGAVEALAWCCEQESPGPGAGESGGEGEEREEGSRVDTLLVSVRGAPCLFYVRLFWGGGAGGGSGAPPASAQGQSPPLLRVQPLTPMAALCSTHGEALPLLLHPCPFSMALYRAPLTEDCDAGDVSWQALAKGAAGPAAAAAVAAAAVPPAAAAAPAPLLLSSEEAAAHPALFIQHGNTVMELAIGPPPLGTPPGHPCPPPLVAAAAEGGTVYVFRLGRFGRQPQGSAPLRRRLLGRLQGAPTSASSAPRLAWQPRQPSGDALHLAAVSPEGSSVEVLSVGSGRSLGRVGNGSGGVVKGLAWAPDGSVLVTCGFDKMVSVWGCAGQ
jgi:hypothetical protein